MSYLNIYPKYILATQKDDDSFQGEFTYSLEQYGLLLQDTRSDIKLYQNLASEDWHLLMHQFDEIDTSYFRKFTQCLGNYIFSILQISPKRSIQSGEPSVVEIFFNDVYFDLSGGEPILKKISEKTQPQ